MVLLSAQGMPVAKIAEVTFTSDDRVRDVLHNVNTDGLFPLHLGAVLLGRTVLRLGPEDLPHRLLAQHFS